MESSSYLIVFLTILSITQTLAIQRPTNTTIYTEFIKTSCKTTMYPDLCYNSLLTHAPVIQSSPQLLANTALSVTLDNARTTSDAMSRMSRLPGMRTGEAGAMRDCWEVLSDVVAELQSSMKEMSEMKDSKNFGLLMNDVQTWVSSALTDEDTCMDGFEGKVIDGRIKTIVRGKIEIICHLTSNSLALINNFAKLHG